MNVSDRAACPEPSRLHAFLDESLDELEEERVEQHVAGCARCRRSLEDAAGGPALWEGVAAHLRSEHEAHDTPAPDDAAALLDQVLPLLGPTDDPSKLGRLGDYEVVGIVGSGGTGIVLKALEPRLDRFVAIKLLAPHYRTSGVARRRFEREARAVAAVVHEHVVPIHAVDEHAGLPFLVMRYVPGPSLQERLDRDGPLDACEAVRLGLQVARALAAAHAQGLVHRDVKPANVLLERGVERAVVTDFGLARVADEAATTRSGTLTGTPQYMSPEQARGGSIDLRSDLFSLGSLLYTTLAGRPPFRAETIYGVLQRVTSATPRPLREVAPTVPAWLAALVAKLMRAEPAERFQTADQVAAALAAELAHLQDPGNVPEPARAWAEVEERSAPGARRRFAAPVAVGAVVLGLGAAAWAAWGSTGGAREDGDGSSQASLGALLPGASAQDGGGPGAPAGAGPSAGATVSWSAATSDDGGTVGSTQALEQVFDVAGLSTVRVEAQDARVRIVPASADALALRLERVVRAEQGSEAAALVSRHELAATVVDDALALRLGFADAPEARAARERFEALELTLHVPAGLLVDVATERGDVAVRGHAGGVRASSTGGALELSDCDGAVRLWSRGGAIRVDGGCAGGLDVSSVLGSVALRGVEGEADVRASGGAVVLGPCSGALYVQTSGADVDVQGVGGPLTVYAAAADVAVELRDAPSADARFLASGGDVELVVAPGVPVRLVARGAVDSTLAFEREESDAADGGVRHLLTLEGGGHVVELASAERAVRVTQRELPALADAAPEGADADGADADGEPADVAQELGGSDSSGSSLGGSGLGGSGLGGSGLGGSGLGGSGLGDSGLGGSGLGGSGLGGSGLGGSGLGGSGLGGSGDGQASMVAGAVSREALERTAGPVRPGALAPVEFDAPRGNVDGYVLYLPPSHGTRPEGFPLLVFLQGSYGVGGPVSALSDWGLLRLLRDETDPTTPRNRLLLDGFVVLAPHIVDGQYDDHPDVIQGLIDEVLATTDADPRRVHLTGLSRGGHGTWGLGARLPDTFASLVPIGGSPRADTDVPLLCGPAFWIAHDRRDPVAPFDAVAHVVGELERTCAVEFGRYDRFELGGTEVLDRRHVLAAGDFGTHDAWTPTYTSAVFYEWLAAQVRERPATLHGTR